MKRTELVEIDEGSTRARAVRLAVEDNGPGFPANILRRAFEPYVTTKPSGTGLGLAMVKKIVDEHQGAVSVTSSDRGATSTVRIPQEVPQPAAAEPARRDAAGSQH